VGGGSDVLLVDGLDRSDATSGVSEAGIVISRGGGRREVLFAMGTRCGEEPWTRGGLSVEDTGTVRVGGGKDVLFGTEGGGGARARAVAGSAPTGAGGLGAGGSGRVTRGGAISSPLTSSAESAGTRDASSPGACAAPKSSVAFWPCTELDRLDAATTLSPPCTTECCPISAACVNAPTSTSCGTRVCASSKSDPPSNSLKGSSPGASCNGACA